MHKQSARFIRERNFVHLPCLVGGAPSLPRVPGKNRGEAAEVKWAFQVRGVHVVEHIGRVVRVKACPRWDGKGEGAATGAERAGAPRPLYGASPVPLRS
jgi:hypothetical protein